MARIAEPDDALFAALIELLFADRGLHIPAEALRFIAERVDRDYCTAERVVEAIDRFAIADRARLTMPTVRRALAEAGLIDQRGDGMNVADAPRRSRALSSTANCRGWRSTAACSRKRPTPAHPLLERLRFLSISGSNLDEFFMTRVAGLKGAAVARDRGSVDRRADPDPAARRDCRARPMRWSSRSRPSGSTCASSWPTRGSRWSRADQLTRRGASGSTDHFREQILPVLTPQAIDPSHPFPFIPNRGFSLIFALQPRRRQRAGDRIADDPGDAAAVRRACPAKRRRGSSPSKRRSCAHFEHAVPRLRSVAAGAFRVLRDSDIEVEEEAEDLVRYFRSAIKRRRRGRVIRLEFDADTPDRARGAGPRRARREPRRWSPKAAGSSASPTWRSWSRPTGPTSNSRPTARASPSGSPSMTATASPRSAPRTSSSTTPTKASRWWSPSCARRPRIPTSSRSSRRCTAPASSRRSSTRWSPRPKPASRSPRWSN